MSCCDYSHDRAGEVMQQVYVEILEGRAVYRGESGLRTWLFAVIRRVAWRHTRSLRLMERLKSAVAGFIEREPPADDSSTGLERQQRTLEVVDALRKLSAQQRQIIELVYYRDFTLEEAALILGVSAGSARTHYHRAKRRLARTLDINRQTVDEGTR